MDMNMLVRLLCVCVNAIFNFHARLEVNFYTNLLLEICMANVYTHTKTHCRMPDSTDCASVQCTHMLVNSVDGLSFNMCM